MINEDEKGFLERAIELSRQGMNQGNGGPFGCVIVVNKEIVGEGYNMVTSTNDPTAHAEIVAIRQACKKLKTFQLYDCEIYTSCEPCPMCLGAIYWARPKKVYFANTREDAAAIGFDDQMIYDELGCEHSARKIPIVNLGRIVALKVFEEWNIKKDQ